jgi:hypothetical protein
VNGVVIASFSSPCAHSPEGQHEHRWSFCAAVGITIGIAEQSTLFIEALEPLACLTDCGNYDTVEIKSPPMRGWIGILYGRIPNGRKSPTGSLSAMRFHSADD